MQNSADAHYLAAWARLCHQMPGHQERLWRERTGFLAALSSGSPQVEAEFVTRLWPFLDLNWPWHEHWARFFRERNIVPYMWRDSDHPERLRLHLFRHTAFKMAHAERSWAQSCDALAGFGWTPGSPFPSQHPIWTGWRLVIPPGDPEEILIEEFNKFLVGEHEHRPPYFPGDRSQISYISKRRK